ncbi:DUF5131 family protein [Acidithiobacillus thiooxidans]|uniref:DUF5131 family protein n=1 Tax=Acidithiobacillus thiooxidans TaxID=930 RepID=UPI0035B5DE8C
MSRPIHPEWVKYIQKQREQTQAPFFFRQWGESFLINQKAPEVMEGVCRFHWKAKIHEDQQDVDKIFERHCNVPQAFGEHGRSLFVSDLSGGFPGRL